MAVFYQLKTSHGSLVTEDRATGEVASFLEADTNENRPVLIAYVPTTRSNTCFLISEHNDRLWMPPTLEGHGILPLGLAAGHAGTVSLYDPGTGLWACATPLDGAIPPRGRLVLDHRKINLFQKLTLVTMQPIFVPTEVTKKASRLEAMLAMPFDLAMLGTVRPEDAAALQAVAHFASLSELRELSRVLMASPKDSRIFADLFPDEIMARHGLPALADWIARRDQPATTSPRRKALGWLKGSASSPAVKPVPAKAPTEQELSVDFDPLSTIGFTGDYVSLPHTATALARRMVVPRRDLCIVATARNEGLYILEWLAYHRAIGVEDVFLYTNDNDDGSDTLLSALAQAGALHWMRNQLAPGGRAQRKAYGHALGVRPEVLDYRWALIIDLDEYFVVNPVLFSSAMDFLAWHEATPCDAIALSWVIHGSAEAARWRDEFIMRRFPHSAGYVDVHIKTLCRPRYFNHSTPHYPTTYNHLPFTFRGANGEPHIPLTGSPTPAQAARPNAEFAWINHYFFKSSEEFLWKWSRNRGGQATLHQPSNAVLTADFVQSFMGQFSAQGGSRVGADQCAPGFSRELESLMALPGVANASAHVKKIYADRIRTIVPMFVDAPGILAAGDVGQAFLATLGL